MKKFSDVKVGDMVYLIEPLSTDIIESEVIASRVHPKSKSGRVWVLDFLRKFKIPGVTDESLKEARTTYGASTSIQALLNKDEFFTIIIIPPRRKDESPALTVLCTELNYLKSWLNKTGKETAELIKAMKKLG